MSVSVPARRRLSAGFASAVALILAMSVLAFAPRADAATSAPTNLTSDSNAGVVPTFSWDAAADASRFEIQVARDSGFQQLIVSEGTVNTSFVPRAALPAGTIYWRVRSFDTAQSASAYSTSTYVQTPLAGPGLATPSDGAVIAPPQDSVKLTWDPVPGASQYEVQISRDSTFTTVEYGSDPRAAAYVLPSLPVTGTWYWRVQGRLTGGINTTWSSTRSFSYGQLPPVTRVAPAQDAVVQDSVLSWSPVAGAASYDLQISTDINFQANSLVHERSAIVGTTYARPGTLDNDQYYWRVRARDAHDNVQDWSRADIWRFERAWPDQPQLEYPADRARVGDPIHFEWTPIPHASRYELQLASDANFNSVVARCTTTSTSYIPVQGGDCMPGAEGTYYWRVVAFDDFAINPPRTTDTLCPVGADSDCRSIEVRRFTYAPPLVDRISPEDGETVTVPHLTWAPYPGASRYKVTITSLKDGSVIDADTAATAFTPRGVLEPATYRWDVMPLSEDNRVGTSLLASSEPTFTVVAQPAATASSPEPLAPLTGSFARFPTLTWTPVKDAVRYRIWLRQAGTVAWSVRQYDFGYPAAEDPTTDFLASGDYEWKVEAFSPSQSLGVSGGIGRFTISALPPVTGHKVALTNAGLAAGDTCAAALPAECQNLRQTPVLSWSSNPEVGYYKLYVARDRALTNIYRNLNGITVMNTRWTPPEQFEDSQAGSAYYWLVVPCKAGAACGPKTLAGHAFNKKSNPVQVVSPGMEKTQGTPPAETIPTVANAVTLKWSDYLSTNQNAVQDDTTPLAAKSTLEAREYRVQVSQDENFQTLLDDQWVDQLEYTAFDRTYPEGPLYWRVQAYDGSDRQLSWSPTYVFRKVSPAPVPTSPADGGTVSGSVTVGWDPLPFARSYDVEVYRNADRNASPSNLVAWGNTRQVAWAPADALPVSDQAYVWRVRRRDAGNREGAWSAWTSFVVRDAVPELVSPAAGVKIHPTRTTFTWRGVTGASGYLWQWRRVGEANPGDEVQTQGLAYAPVRNLPDGALEWRVLPLDARGQITVRPSDRDTLWRRFTIGNAPSAVSPPQIFGSPQVGAVLDSTPPTWAESGVQMSYQWFRDGWPIQGATSPSYRTVRDDLSRQVSLRVYGDLPGYSQATTTSNAFQISFGAAPTLAGSFLIGGTGRVGTSISPSTPVWNEPNVTTSVRWLVAGQEVADGSGPLTLTPQMVGKAVTLRAVGRRDGYSDAEVTSNPVQVVAGEAAVALSPVAITGTPRAGETLSVSGSWSNQPQLTYQWMVDGAPIAGEVNGTYRVRPSDAARAISARVTATREGYDPGSATTAAVIVAKLTSTTELALTSTTATVKTVKKVKAAVIVRVPDVEGPLGSIKIYDGKKVIKTVTLTASRKGQVSVKVGKLKKGKHKLKAVYLGTGSVTGSASALVKLTVTKR